MVFSELEREDYHVPRWLRYVLLRYRDYPAPRQDIRFLSPLSVLQGHPAGARAHPAPAEVQLAPHHRLPQAQSEPLAPAACAPPSADLLRLTTERP